MGSRGWFGSGLALLAFSLAGCALEGDAGSVALPPTPDSFRAERSRAAPAIGDWPRQFGSAELAMLMERARVDNLDVAAAFARIQQADGLARSTTSALFPQLSGSQNASRTVTSGASRAESPPFAQGNSTS